MSDRDSNKAQKEFNEKEYSNQSPLNQGSNGNTNGFVQYIINPEKFDELISSINNYSTRVDNYSAKMDNYAAKMDVAIEQMKKSNENQEKALTLLTELINKLNPPVEKDKKD